MPKYISKELSIHNAKVFKDSLSLADTTATKQSTILYAVLGRAEAYSDESVIPAPVETDQDKHYELWRQAWAGKKITSGDVSHVVPRHNWATGTVYAMYRDRDTNLYGRSFYIITDQNNVYKCLKNNKGAVSTIRPTGFSTSAFTTSDGYHWKYMYTVSLGRADKFMTAAYIPVQNVLSSDGSTEGDRQTLVHNAAANGAIEVVETVNVGSGYQQLANGIVESAATDPISGVCTVTMSATSGDTGSPVDKYYNGSSVYIKSGTGAGQLRRVVGYSGTTKTLTVNTAFQTLPDTDSTMIISPTVTIIGDGLGAKAYSKVDTSSGAIANVFMITTGTGYRRASVLVTANSSQGTGATANVIMSPIGGHGKDAVRELGGDKLLLNAQFDGSLGVSSTARGYIPANTDFRSISLLKDPILKVNASNNPLLEEKIANTSNSPVNLRLSTELLITYQNMTSTAPGAPPVNPLVAGDTITQKRVKVAAEQGTLQFVTELSSVDRASSDTAMKNAVKGANADIIYIRDDEVTSDNSFFTMYINNVESYADIVPFTKDDVLFKRGSPIEVATVSTITGPEANTFSGQFLHTENISKITRSLDQTEDIKIILDF
jgi:hypothetical protein